MIENSVIVNGKDYILLEYAQKIIADMSKEFSDLVEELELRNVRLQQQLPYYAKVSMN